MPPPLDEFRRTIARDTEAALKQRLDNCRAKPDYVEYAVVVKEELDARFPGWDRPRARRGGSRPTVARFRGRVERFDTARAAYIWLVERFSNVNPTLFTDVRWETTGYVAVGRRRGPHGAARNYFAKSPHKLFLHTPSLADDRSNFHRLTNGWYLNLNLNTRENFEILCRFSAVSQMSHGDDWDWEVLDPTEELSDTRERTRLAAEADKELDRLLSQPPKADG
jgi:hypothetical protein